MIDNLRSAWTGSRSFLHFKVRLIRSRAEHRNKGEGERRRRSERPDETGLFLVISCGEERRCCQLLWSVCGQPGRMQTPLQQEPVIENAGDGNACFLAKVSLAKRTIVQRGRVQVAGNNRGGARAVGGGGVVEISSGAAQSYIETYYLQLKATRVSFIHSLTHLQKRHRISPDPLPVCLSPLYVDWKKRTNKRKAETGKLRGNGWGKAMRCSKWGAGKQFYLYEGRRPRQFPNIWDISFAGPAKPLYTVANVKRVLGTPRSPWPTACFCLECKCGLREQKKRENKRLKRERGEYFWPHVLVWI